jgi:L-fuconolactonase
MRLDSHHHFWNYLPSEYPWIDDQKKSLQRDFGPPELQAVVDPTGIDRVISVQARQTLEETRWLLEIAEQHSLVAGVVGWVPLVSEELRGLLERWTKHPKLKAVRHVVQDEPDDRFLLGDAFQRGIKTLNDFGLVYDILIFAKHLETTIEFVDRHPQQAFVLDHIAKPTIRRNAFDQAWAKHIRELAKRDQVACKFSGVATEVRENDWDINLIRPYWETVLEAFGPRRLMFGSDWPVCLLKTDYRRWVQTVEKLTASLSTDEQEWFWKSTATQWYHLDPLT